MRFQHYFMLLLAWLCLAPWALSQPPGKDARALGEFQTALRQDGFLVKPGAAGIINLVAEWCANTPGVDHALYANNQPYLQVRVPKSAQEPNLLTSNFKLAPGEAIVLIGLTPPPEKYFGFHPFLRTRVDQDGIRQSLWATTGDAVNNLTVRTIGPTPFNSPVALIFTPDQGTDARVRAALRRAGYPAAIINTVVFPASMLKLGHGDSADELFIALRNAMWQNETDGDAYVRNPPLHIFRVTPPTETVSNPFPAPNIRVRGTGQTEMGMTNKLGELRQAIITANPALHATDIVSKPNFYEGYDYIQRGFDPYADSRDGFWLTAGYMPDFGLTDELTLADDEFLMVYGVNHVATGKASYHSVTMYSSREGKVPISGADDRAFPGTASPYLPGDPAAADLMYAYKVSRNCGNEPNCVQLTMEACPRLTIGPNTALGIIFRTYLEPSTKVGAAMPEILYDRVIKFSPRPF